MVINKLRDEKNIIEKEISQKPILLINIQPKPIRKNKKKHDEQQTKGKVYECEFCSCKFNCHRALGGHTSKMHPQQSEKFIKKKQTREERKNIRQLNEEMKRKYIQHVIKLNYDDLMQTAEGKQEIMNVLKAKAIEFRLFKKNYHNYIKK